ncbi:LuxR C-terminal-related transcriptional regulator [Streptomyces sp. NPDC051677]|uniref:LuxR C-terminal-related transcriptional regulator n=1 Tax=Streptomyces sp. NPDC051677 TaxID=3365669 RepID=UPI0037D74D88
MYRRVLEGERLPSQEVPDCLHDLQLVMADPHAPGRVVAVPPGPAAHSVLNPLQDVIEQQQRTVRSLQATFASFEEIYADSRKDELPTLTLLKGGELINKALEDAVENCHEELMTAQPGGGRAPHVLGEALARDLRLLDRGVRQRTIYQHTVRAHRATLSYIEKVASAGAEVRTLAEVFERLIICDRQVAFIPVSDDRGAAALQVRHPALLRFMTQSFESAWARSVPIEPEQSPVRPPVITSDIQRAILSAVVSGETDDSIARRLGMSRRSVAEHVRKVSQQLSSTSRAQLGYLLALSGFLDEDGGAQLG